MKAEYLALQVQDDRSHGSKEVSESMTDKLMND